MREERNCAGQRKEIIRETWAYMKERRPRMHPRRRARSGKDGGRRKRRGDEKMHE